MNENQINGVSAKAEHLKAFIEEIYNFRIVVPDIPYGHMGATICDAMLQAGLHWESVVKPRVEKIKNNYPEAAVTSGFLQLIRRHGAKVLVDFQDEEKPMRIRLITEFFYRMGIETENDLKKWLRQAGNETKLKQQRGVGDKTCDYFKLLVGIPTAAVDRHMTNFLRLAGIESSGYNEALEILHETADLMNLNRTVLDHSIWKYMSQGKAKLPCRPKQQGKKTYIDSGQDKSAHSGNLVVKHSFNDAWDYVDNEGSLELTTSTGHDFKTLAGISGEDRMVIRFFHNGREYGRAYECCWGHYYNCNRTRIGMYVRALDEYMALKDERLLHKEPENQ
mgnify:CR=1 FL=1|jgi:hypothetical protein